MNHKTKVNTSPSNEQAENATLPLLQLDALSQQLFDIGNSALLARVLCEISYDEIDALRNRGINSIADRIEALIQAAHRNVVLIEESLAAISLGLEEAKGGAQ